MRSQQNELWNFETVIFSHAWKSYIRSKAGLAKKLIERLTRKPICTAMFYIDSWLPHWISGGLQPLMLPLSTLLMLWRAGFNARRFARQLLPGAERPITNIGCRSSSCPSSSLQMPTPASSPSSERFSRKTASSRLTNPPTGLRTFGLLQSLNHWWLSSSSLPPSSDEPDLQLLTTGVDPHASVIEIRRLTAFAVSANTPSSRTLLFLKSETFSDATSHRHRNPGNSIPATAASSSR